MKKIFITGLFLLASTSIFAQMEVNKQIQMTGAAVNDRRITNISNASAVTPVNTDALNIATFQSNYTNYGAGTFATGTYTLTLVPAAAQYWEGMIVSFKAGAINTGVTNLNVNGLGARAIVKAGGIALAAGDIQANQMVTVVYNLTGTRFEVIGSMGTDSWNLRGNTGTNPTNDFIGTTDAQDLVLRTNNASRMRLFSDGRVVVNNATATATDIFSSYATGTGNAVAGIVSGSGVGVRAGNSSTTGSGILTFGNNSTAYTLLNGAGLTSNGIPYGLIAFGNRAADGWGVISVGNDLPSSSTIAGGGGGAFNGNQWGVYGNAAITGAANNGTDRAAFIGNFTSAGTTGATVYVGARIGGVVYKVLGTGGAGGASVSTVMPTRDGERILFAPESPENWFFDIGEVKLVNGKARVELDPIFFDCISKAKPFKVFVQGAENTLGAIRIKTRGENWFELEDVGGASNGTVMFNIYAIWNGKENLRLPKFVAPTKAEMVQKVQEYKTEEKSNSKK